MTYIRIKIKHIVIVLAAVLLAVLAIIYLQGYLLYAMGKISESTGDTERAGVYYDRAAKDFPGSGSSLYAAKSKLEMLLKDKNFGYFRKIKLTGSSSLCDGAYISADSADEINRQYEDIARSASKDDTLAAYTIDVALVNYFAGYGDRAAELLAETDYIKDRDLEQVRELHLAAVHMGLGEMQEGLEAIKGSLEQQDKYSVFRKELYKYYCFMTGDAENFKQTTIDSSLWYRQTKDLKDVTLKPLMDINNTLSGYDSIVDANSKLQKNGNVFSGTITGDGKPMAYVMVYLKDINFRNVDSSIIGMQDGITIFAVTDKDGRFNMQNVPDGLYGLGVSTDWQRIQGKSVLMNRNFDLRFTGDSRISEDISFYDASTMVKASGSGDGKIRFDFNLPVKGDYYIITMGEVRKVEDNVQIANYTYRSDEITASPYVLDVGTERRRGKITGASFSSDGIDPYDLMEPFYHTGDYTYFITAYDKNGEILFDSMGITQNKQKNVIPVQGSEWSEADKLLLEKKYDEAIKIFETQVDDGQTGLHALKVLAKLYNNGWVYNAETHELDNKDKQKAKKYFEMLESQIKDNEQILSSLAGIYIDEGSYLKGIETLERIKENGYIDYQIGQAYGYMGSFSKAEGYYDKYEDSTGYGADKLMMLYVLQDRTGLLADKAKNYDNRIYYADYTKAVGNYLKKDRSGYEDFFRLVRNDEPDPAGKLIEGRDGDLARLYEGLLLLQKRIPDYREREKLYSDLYNKVNDPDIKELMKYFGKAGVQSGFGDNF